MITFAAAFAGNMIAGAAARQPPLPDRGRTTAADPSRPAGPARVVRSEPAYGLHRTPEPDLIDEAASHGCVRSSECDAEELAAMTGAGAPLELVDG